MFTISITPNLLFPQGFQNIAFLSSCSYHLFDHLFCRRGDRKYRVSMTAGKKLDSQSESLLIMMIKCAISARDLTSLNMVRVAFDLYTQNARPVSNITVRTVNFANF